MRSSPIKETNASRGAQEKGNFSETRCYKNVPTSIDVLEAVGTRGSGYEIFECVVFTRYFEELTL